ncbi:MAG: DUF2141 domain-containing protein [Deltaproteobacteria bacterium]|nr:DUF2141 domain-containing protein [Deltaproteobacteria bacterium]
MRKHDISSEGIKVEKPGRVSGEYLGVKLGTDWLGVPKEGYGFSNDAEATIIAPRFSIAGLSVLGNELISAGCYGIIWP